METKLSDYITAKDAAAAWSVTARRVIMYLADGSIPGALKVGNTWLIPKDAEKPPDGRINNRRGGKRKKQKEDA